MGCDIHAYLEYSDDGNYWRSLTDNAGSRDYRMFGLMAGVRYSELALFQPKGLPDGPLSWQAENSHWISVAPDAKPEYADWDGWTSKEYAEKWVKSGLSEAVYDGETIKRVTNPDHHSHSWLSSNELSRCVEKYRDAFPNWKAPHEFVGLLAAMQAIEANGGKTRLVFWFDN